MRYRLLIVCLLMAFYSSGRAEDSIPDIRMETVFRQMPDSVIPSLSENNRLDMIDFMNSQMKAEVTNLLGGKSEMLALTHDSICIRVSDGLTVRMLLLQPVEVIDNCEYVICLAHTYGIDSLSYSTRIEMMTTDWHPISFTPSFSEVDEQRVKKMDLQTILKWRGDILKKN